MHCMKIACFLCLCCAATAARADITYFTADSSVIYDSNIVRSELSRDIEDDFALEAGLTAARSFRLGDKSGLVVRGGAHVAKQFRFEDLSRLSLEAGASYRIQPMVGFTNPWIELALGVARLEYRDSRIRDGWVSNAGISVGKYFTDRIRATAGWSYELRNAEQGQVFDWHRNTVTLGVDFRLSENGTLYANGSRIYGDQVSSASVQVSNASNSPSPGLIFDPVTGTYITVNGNSVSNLSSISNASKAIARDTALDKNATNQYFAYRVGAITDVVEIGFNYAIKGNLALDFSLQYYNSDADGGLSYDGTNVRAGLLYRF